MQSAAEQEGVVNAYISTEHAVDQVMLVGTPYRGQRAWGSLQLFRGNQASIV